MDIKDDFRSNAYRYNVFGGGRIALIDLNRHIRSNMTIDENRAPVFIRRGTSHMLRMQFPRKYGPGTSEQRTDTRRPLVGAVSRERHREATGRVRNETSKHDAQSSRK